MYYHNFNEKTYSQDTGKAGGACQTQHGSLFRMHVR